MQPPRSSVDQNLAEDRPGLHYKPIRFNALPKPIFVIRDHRREDWVDLRSVCEALGVAWKRFDLHVKARREYFKTEECIDRKRRETELIQPDRLLRWIDVARPLLEQHSPQVLARALALRTAWRMRLQSSAGQMTNAAAETPSAAELQAKLRTRKITAAVVEQLFRLRSQKVPFTKAADRLGIGLSTAKKVASDTYPDLPPDARDAWDRTFGQIRNQEGANTPAQGDSEGEGGAGVA
jgi:hypothetical protein